ncbi:MAG TPA: energy transducer TonB, partial [Pricia sp.]|nr:energy transducer TonB [Pricia sp.]
MEPKKNPKSDVGRNSGLYFVIGLALVMGLVYGALEWKTYD